MGTNGSQNAASFSRQGSGSGNEIISEGTQSSQSSSGPQKKLAACDSFRESELSLHRHTSLRVLLED